MPERAEEPDDVSKSEQARQLAELMGTEEFQSLSLTEKFARLRKFMTPNFAIQWLHSPPRSASEREKKLQEFQNSEEYRQLEGPARTNSVRQFIKDVYNTLPKTAEEEAVEAYFDRNHGAIDRATTAFEAMRCFSSAREFLLSFGPDLPAGVAEVIRGEKLNVSEIRELSPRLKDALQQAGWDPPAQMRDD